MRVFHDRLIDDADRVYFKQLLQAQFAVFGLEEAAVLNSERVIFGDFYDGKDCDPRIYKQLQDGNKLMSKLYDF